ncbi:hypothetical protein N1851_014210 [Merluccius polli]|uniref:DDE Tnp4 domain-containing protein n=1 Tax=Merluccius polli TaxID=89951 RepID=A0AA47MUM9_MERPO|nr:hypothetical protein N1851_014210 [Merluccius polli]
MMTCSSIETKVHSINTQIVVDATFNILDVVAKWPAGSTHDSCILMENGLRQLFERHHVPLGVNCWVTVAIPARHLDTLSQSTTGSTVKSTQKYTKCCGERNWADEMSISCPAQRNTPEPREGKYSDHCMRHSPQPSHRTKQGAPPPPSGTLLLLRLHLTLLLLRLHLTLFLLRLHLTLLLLRLHLTLLLLRLHLTLLLLRLHLTLLLLRLHFTLFLLRLHLTLLLLRLHLTLLLLRLHLTLLLLRLHLTLLLLRLHLTLLLLRLHLTLLLRLHLTLLLLRLHLTLLLQVFSTLLFKLAFNV